MRDFFTNGFVITVIILCGWAFMASLYFGKDDVQYQFRHSYIENIDSTKVKTETNRCVIFNSKKITLEEAKKAFIKEYGNGELSINSGCLANIFGKKVSENFRISN